MELSTYKTSFRVILVLLVAGGSNLFLTGCNSTETFTDASSAQGDPSVGIIDRVNLDKATHEDLSPEVVECRGGQICVEICHRPPGNPENSKTMLLPLKATLAHVKHGGPEHVHKDYLGPCVGQEGEPPVDDGGTGDDEDDGGGDPIPPWCAQYQSVDSDCDGFMDESGEPLF